MKLEFVNPGFSYSLDSMMLFEESNQSDWWRDANFYFYPMLKKEELRALPMSERRAYYQSKLEPFWVEKQTEFAEKLDRWNAHWQKHEGVIAQALSEGFDRDLSGKLEKIQGRMALGNVCPRFLEQQAFDVFWMNSERGAMGISMHEITHFIWFDAWNKHFGDAPAEYEQPNLKWILSEMAVYPFLSDPRLIPLNPYYPEEKGGCVAGAGKCQPDYLAAAALRSSRTGCRNPDDSVRSGGEKLRSSCYRSSAFLPAGTTLRSAHIRGRRGC